MVFRRRKITNRIQSLVDEVLHLLQKESAGGLGDFRPMTIQVARLEQRVLMSASPMVILAAATADVVESGVMGLSSDGVSQELEFTDDGQSPAEAEIHWDSVRSSVSEAQTSEADEGVELGTADENDATGVELIVIDYRVKDADTLLAGLLNENRDIRLLRLNMDEDGLQQITAKLEQLGNVSAIHLITHGRDGEILLGSTQLNSATLAQHTPELLAWQHMLTPDADLLLYGCDVAGTAEGQDFVESLQRLTGADVAASTDTTGHVTSGANWVLEYSSGVINAPGIFSAMVMDTWQYELVAGQTITVTTTNDVVDGDTTSVSALLANMGADGRISLREAILAANRNADVDEIILSAGEYFLQISGNDEQAQSGDFDINEDVVIRGAGASTTVINGNSIDRIFEVRGSSSLTLSGVAVTGGLSSGDGGGIKVDKNAFLTLDRVIISGNSARNGGGIDSRGSLTATDVVLNGNVATHDGGGLANSGSSTITRGTFANNTAANGGGIHTSGNGSELNLVNVTISGNSASSSGGGIFSAYDTSLTNVTVAFNTAGTSGAGIQRSASVVTLQNTLLESNRLTNLTNANVSGTVQSLGNNLDSDGTAELNQSSDISGVSAQLELLASDGSLTLTHALKSSSAAIDKGTSVGAPAEDQRGVARDGAVDIGAYEFDRSFLSTSEFQVNDRTLGTQSTSGESRGSQQAIARDHAGNYIITWSSQDQDGDGWGVYAQRFDYFGRKVGGEFRVNETTADNQQWARIAADAAGNFIITWTSWNQDGTTQSVYARRYSAAGVALTGEFRVNTTASGSQKNSVIAMNADGQFVIAWNGDGPDGERGVFFRRYDANGTALDAVDRRAAADATTPPSRANVAIDASGNFVVMWQRGQRISFQRYLASGTAAGNATFVDVVTSNSTDASMAMDAAGNFTIVYREQTTQPGIWARGYNADGSPRTSSNLVQSGGGTSPSISMAANGQYIVVWQGTGTGDTDVTGIFARKYNADGTANGSRFLVNQYTVGAQNQPSVTMLDSDNFVVTWSGKTPLATSEVIARQFGTAVSRTLQAQADYATIATNTSVNIDVLVNDARSSGGTAIRLDVSDPVNGTAVINSNGTITYTPNTNYAGTDSFTYLISDGTDGTTHYWSLGGTAVDSVADADGTLHGTTTVAGSYGTGLSFNGTSDYVEIPDFEYTPSFTVSFDFKIDSNSGTVYEYLYSHGDVNATNSLNIFVGESSHGNSANVLKTTFGDSSDAYDVNALNTNIASLIGDGQWHTYTLTVDKTGGSRVYIDGQLRVTANGRGGDTFNPSGNLVLGARQDLDPQRFFGGSLDSVRVFNKSLSASQVSLLNNGLSPSGAAAQSSAPVYITVQNAAPVAVTNGPYTTSVGVPVTFSAIGSSDLNGDALTYEWDLRYDGVAFNADVTGLTVSRDWAQLQSLGVTTGTSTIALRVVDARGAETISTTMLQVLTNAAPTAIDLSDLIIPGESPGAVAGSLSSTDSTFGDAHTYTVSDSRFEVVGSQLKLKSDQSLSRDSETSVTLTVTSTDLANNSITRSFLVAVGNGSVIARDNTATTNENTSLSITGPGVLGNDDRAAGTITPGAVLAYNAAEDAVADAVWEDATGVAGYDFALGSGVTRNSSPTTSHYGILSSMVFDGTATSGGVINQSLAGLPGNPTDGAATFELWFRPSDLTRSHILLDSGSAVPGTGLSVRLNGTQLEFAVYTNGSGPSVTSNINTLLAGGDFVQFTGTVRLTGGVASIEMFVNGVSVGTSSSAGFTTWSDALENLAIGRIDGSVNVVTAGADRFAGEIAQFRFYENALTATQVQNNFNAVAGTQAGLTVTSIDTTTDTTRGLVSITADGSVTYNPNGQFDSLAAGATAIDTVRYTVSDGSQTDTGRLRITVTGVNDAPVMSDASPSLGTVVADAVSSPVTVSDLLGSTVSDVDSGSVRGVAVTGTTGVGTWQYSNNGKTWINFGTVSVTQALLLQTTDQIRFVGSGTTAGSATLSFAAWDQTAGTAGTKFDVAASGRGGSTAFSTTTNTATLTVQRINRAPVGSSDSYTLDEDTVLNTTPGWFDSNWALRQRISFNNAAGGELLNTAVLVTLNSSQIDYARTQNNGQDLRFVDGNGALLNYEIETWDESGTSRVWVLVPQIDAASATDSIWMYYGNSLAADAQNADGVWAGQAAVLHLNDPVADSSVSSLGLTDSGTTASAGIIGGARTFDGVDSFVRFDSSAQLDDLFPGGGTISAWINPTGWGEAGYGRIADKADTTFRDFNGAGWALQVTNTGRLMFETGFSSEHGEWLTATGTITLNTWQHVAVVYNASSTSNNPLIFVNGTEVAVTRTQSPSGTYLTDAGNQLTVGNYSQETTRTFDGSIDEFRANTTSLTAAQVLADYRSMNGTLTTHGAVQSGGVSVLMNDSDADNDPLSVALVSGPSHSSSFVLSSDGTFTYEPRANFAGIDTFTYTVSDGITTSSPITVTLNVLPINDAPTAITLSNASFAGYTPGVVVGTILVADPDTGDSHTFIVSDARFEVVGGSLKLRNGQSIHPVNEPTVNLSITATDIAGASRIQAFTLTALDPNTSPVLSVTAITSSAAENTVLNSDLLVAAIAVSDDGFGTNTLSLSGADASLFHLVGNDLYLRAGTVLDWESRAFFNVVVQVDDPLLGGTPDDSRTFTFTVLDVNEAPSVALTPIITSLAEDTSTGSAIAVAAIVVTDDALGTNQLSLSGADASKFQIIGSNLYLRAGTLLDFESLSQLDVTLSIDDTTVGGTPDGTAEFSLQITDVNEAPVVHANGGYTIFEGESLVLSAAGTSDPDGDAMTYEWDLSGNGAFIASPGVTLTRTWEDLSTLSVPINDDGSRNIRLRVTDAAGLSSIVTTTLTVINTPPVITIHGSATAASGQDYVLNLTSSDPGNDAIETWLVNWGDGTTQIVAGSQQMATHRYLTPGGTRSITVTGIDEDGTHAMTGGPLVVNVENNAPSGVSLSGQRVTAGLEGAAVGQISFTDGDFGDTHTTTVNDARFEVAAGILRLRSGQSISYADGATIDIVVTVTDTNGAAATLNTTLIVNRPPDGVAESYAVDGTQRLTVDSPSSGVLANDSDSDGDSLTAVLVTEPTRAKSFGLNADGTFWYRAVAGFSGIDTFTYHVSDGIAASNPVTVTLTVNQPAYLTYAAAITRVHENTVVANPLYVGRFAVNDDGIGVNTVQLAGSDAAFFDLDSENRLYLKSGTVLNYEVKRRYTVFATVDDPAIAGTPDHTRSMTLQVRDVNEVPETIGIPDVTISEDAGEQIISTAPSFSDQDADRLSYSVRIVSQSPALFRSVAINASTGQLRYTTNQDAFGSARLEVTATDTAGLFVRTEFSVHVQPVNDAPVVKNYSGSTFTGQTLTQPAGTLLAGAFDAENQPIELLLLQGPTNGTLTLRSDGSFVYQPDVGYFGTDTFLVAGSDGIATGDAATVSIFVQAPQAPLVGTGTAASSQASGTSAASDSANSGASAGSGTTNAQTVGTSSSTQTAPTGNPSGADSGNQVAPQGVLNRSESPNWRLSREATVQVLPQGVVKTEDLSAILLTQKNVGNSGAFSEEEDDSSQSASLSNERGFAKRTMMADSYGRTRDQMNSSWDSRRELTALELQRQMVYQELAVRADQQMKSFEEKLTSNVSKQGRVVGSVGFVTTGFSVGYLIWAVRGGMLLSGVLSQIPAWTMLDPLMVIDGDGKDDDKESLQTLMDRQQAKLNVPGNKSDSGAG